VTIPPGTLEVKIPEGYTKYLTPEERIKATVPANIIELKRTYDNAREAFGDYRMVILDDNGYVKNRVVRQDKKWRIDTYGWRANDNHVPDISQWQDFGGKDAKIKMLPPSDKYLGCIGVSISGKHKGYKKLDIPAGATLVIFWIDPSKDYICVRYEQHERPKAAWEEDNEWEQHEPTTDTHDGNGSFHSEIVDVTKLAQTQDGKWYPKQIKFQHHSVNRGGARVSRSRKAKIKRIYVDTQGLIDPNLFEWPEELPPPSK
jgi:hypothetical protein